MQIARRRQLHQMPTSVDICLPAQHSAIGLFQQALVHLLFLCWAAAAAAVVVHGREQPAAAVAVVVLVGQFELKKL
jgi:hypothetical protein